MINAFLSVLSLGALNSSSWSIHFYEYVFVSVVGWKPVRFDNRSIIITMSMSSSLFRQKQSDFSADIEDLRQQNRLLYQQNTTLKRSLQELININTELTESIEQFNNSHVDNFPHINQQEIEQLAHQVIELQQELDREKRERDQERAQYANTEQNSNTVEETLKVIEELVNSFRIMQEEYQQELERIEAELENQKNQWARMSDNIEQKLIKFQAEYSKLLQEMKRSQTMIKNLESEVADKSRGMLMSKKEMKISTTIEDLRQTLDKQIEEKDKVIKVYEHLIDSIRTKLNEKIAN